MLNVTAAGWAITLALLVALFAWDLVRSARRPHAVTFSEAVFWSLFYIAVALLFGVVFGLFAGWDLRRSTSPATSSRRACPSTTCSCS